MNISKRSKIWVNNPYNLSKVKPFYNYNKNRILPNFNWIFIVEEKNENPEDDSNIEVLKQ